MFQTNKSQGSPLSFNLSPLSTQAHNCHSGILTHITKKNMTYRFMGIKPVCRHFKTLVRVECIYKLQVMIDLLQSPIFCGTTQFQLDRQQQYVVSHTTQNSQNKWTTISDIETNIFELKMMVKSGLEFFILKFYQPLQSCCCPVQKYLPRRAELAWQVSRYL